MATGKLNDEVTLSRGSLNSYCISVFQEIIGVRNYNMPRDSVYFYNHFVFITLVQVFLKFGKLYFPHLSIKGELTSQLFVNFSLSAI